MERADGVRIIVWMAAIGLAVAATLVHPGVVIPIARRTAEPFLTLAAIVTAGLGCDRLGVFAALGRRLIPDRAGPRRSAAAILTLTALLSGGINLDVAIVVAMPLTVRVAASRGLPTGRAALAATVTANSTSFLLPTSNLTTLLVLNRDPLPGGTYLLASWLPWLLVTAITVTILSLWCSAGAAPPEHDRTVPGEDRPAGATPVLVDLVALFAAASAIRVLLGSALVLPHGFLRGLAAGSLLAATLNNLPVAAALHVVGPTGLWAGVLAMALGPNLLLTGSVASIAGRQLAHRHGAGFRPLAFTVAGAALLPAQLLVATLGLLLTGGLTARG